jgi:hypothetical protein
MMVCSRRITDYSEVVNKLPLNARRARIAKTSGQSALRKLALELASSLKISANPKLGQLLLAHAKKLPNEPTQIANIEIGLT